MTNHVKSAIEDMICDRISKYLGIDIINNAFVARNQYRIVWFNVRCDDSIMVTIYASHICGATTDQMRIVHQEIINLIDTENSCDNIIDKISMIIEINELNEFYT
jgi:hypothetical protein